MFEVALDDALERRVERGVPSRKRFQRGAR
jgi:hypothetical protein